ncbi:hypothetical protein NE237_020984 [Protea cynaroides]|uniref:Uncharacterized protein n=1 Tax=Protea cynaroides TaxID=273540 RepID=A0A9Q0HC82_9MAGN|nr:hypothetical protein NE237_020984 [Protea cynaroides]
MEKDPSGDKLDGLEIISVGALYKGPWDKKYWSSSRGKDRYPYPIGYHAVRIHIGSIYKLEIHEGLKGPLFMITSTDGHSCSGQTPEIAWERFQKKNGPRVKMWHGKRSSCKIDAVELFGFKNPFVQRLLREIVANINGVAEQSFLSSSFFNGASALEHETRFPDSRSCPDLLSCLEKPHITGKRSRKHKMTTINASESSLKRLRPEHLSNGPAVATTIQEIHRVHHDEKCTCTSDGDQEIFINQATLPVSVDVPTTTERGKGPASVKDVSPLESAESLDNCREETDFSQETRTNAGLGFHSTLEVSDGEILIMTESKVVNDSDLCAPDTLDIQQDNIASSVPEGSPSNVRNEVVAAARELHPEEDMDTSTSNISSQKSDYDSVGQELTKSMIRVLLPQALPLLKKMPTRKRRPIRSSEISDTKCDPAVSVVGLKIQEESNGSCLLRNEASPSIRDPQMPIEDSHVEGEERADSLYTCLVSDIQSSEVFKSVIPDSFEDDHYQNHSSNQIPIFYHLAQADQAPNLKDVCNHDTLGLLESADRRHEVLVSHIRTSDKEELKHVDGGKESLHVEANGNKETCFGEALTTPNERLEKGESPTDSHLDKDIELVPNHTEGASVLLRTFSVDSHSPSSHAESIFTNEEEVDTNRGIIRTFNESAFVQEAGEEPSIRKYNGPLSESLICRNVGDVCIPGTNSAKDALLNAEIGQTGDSNNCLMTDDLLSHEFKFNGQHHDLHIAEANLKPKDIFLDIVPAVSQSENVFDHAMKCLNVSGIPDLYFSHVKNHQADASSEVVEPLNLIGCSNIGSLFQKKDEKFFGCREDQAEKVHEHLHTKHSTSDSQTFLSHGELHKRNLTQDRFFPLETEPEIKSKGFVELVGCYVHPSPVLSVFYSNRGDDINICVLCGHLVDRVRTIFIYKVPIKEPMRGYPSFLSYSSIMLPISKDSFGRKIALERYGFQFTPDGQCLVFLDSIKAPCCREQKIHCLCSACTSESFEENAVKVVAVKLGYVSVVAKLKTVESIQYMLVCGHSHLVSVEENGKLHVWVMNSEWSEQVEEFSLQSFDYISPGGVELKRIPKCGSLIVGHNGFGDFGLWDISKHTLLSRFSAPGSSIFQFLPVGFFNWQQSGFCATSVDMEEQVREIMAATEIWFSGAGEDPVSLPLNREDIAIWLLVLTDSNPKVQHDDRSNGCQTSPVGGWRLALLMNNIVIFGSPLDPRASAADALHGHGIIGTLDGLVYLWELSTGAKLSYLHHVKGGGVSLIAADSGSGVFAVAGDECQLLVYLHT